MLLPPSSLKTFFTKQRTLNLKNASSFKMVYQLVIIHFGFLLRATLFRAAFIFHFPENVLQISVDDIELLSRPALRTLECPPVLAFHQAAKAYERLTLRALLRVIHRMETNRTFKIRWKSSWIFIFIEERGKVQAFQNVICLYNNLGFKIFCGDIWLKIFRVLI